MASNTRSANLKSCLLLFLSSVSLVAAQPPPPISLPYPDGDARLRTALVNRQLTDESRTDPWAPPGTKRKLMVSMFYPVPKERCESALDQVEYMPPSTATAFSAYLGMPDGIFQLLRLQVCKPKPGKVDLDKYPVILYSPGFSSSRLLASAQAQKVANAGYVVVTVDHPYDAVSVQFPPSEQFPNGEVVGHSTSTDSPPAALDATIPQRVADVQFVLNTLSSKAGLGLLIPGVSKGLDVKRVAMFGHSLGGATLFAAMFAEPRIMGGFDLDGNLYGFPQSKDRKLPKEKSLALFGRPDHNTTDDATWREGLSRVEGWKRELVLASSGHFTFTDGPLLIKALQDKQILPESLPPPLVAMLGSLPGDRPFKILTTYVIAFMDFVLKDKCPGLFMAPNREFPEVTLMNTGSRVGPWCRPWRG
ncbi:1-alkyl-2-acetylglycerophosphocholine esterase [Drechslerella dactyloides]|uniref:1-alkyl-2-acetylglycerophosphocholine esterase n=1 Tax=Drechslerella dactyloides TaxID=74499 RepID=A0AAD6IZ54_DREDA|nr:1-alkyl-2-acetylglycerophosphocholine esterase [Drechslerella dactyloides]